MKRHYSIYCAALLILLPAFLRAEPEMDRVPDRPMAAREGFEKREMPNRAEMKANIFRMLMSNPEIARSVGVSDETMAKLKEETHSFRQSMVTLRSAAELAQLEVEKIESSDTPNEAKLMKALDEEALRKTAVRKAEAAFELKMRNLLGEETVKRIRERATQHLRERVQAARAGPSGPGSEENRAPWMQGRMEPPPARGPQAAPAPAPDR